MMIKSINRVAENVVEVVFTKNDMIAVVSVERLTDCDALFTLKKATYGKYEFTRRENTHSIVKGIGRGRKPQEIIDKIQKFIDNIFYLNAPMTKEEEKMYDQIMESFNQTEEQTEVSEEEVTEEINNTTVTENKTVTKNKEETNSFNVIERKDKVDSIKKPWLTMTGKVFNGKKARAIENLLENVLIGKDKKFATKESIENILKENNVEGHIVTYHIKQLKGNAYEYIYTIEELETALTIGIDEHGKIEDVI